MAPALNRLLILVALAALGPLARAQAPDLPLLSQKEIAQGYRDGYVLAKPRADHLAMVDAAEAREGLAMRRKFARFGSLRLLKLARGDTTPAAVRRLAASGRYEFVEPDYVRHAMSAPNDPDFSQQWGLNNTGSNSPGVGIAGADIHAITAWNTINAAPNVVVAVLDTGVFNTNTDIQGNLWQNPNVGNNASNPYGAGLYGVNESGNGTGTSVTTDDDGHGTHVSGIIGAIGNNGLDTSGVAWKVQIMALKFIEASGYGTTANEISCLDYAISTGVVSVINASFGESSYSGTEYTAIQAAGAAGIIFVAAAGNSAIDSDLQPFYPANYLLDNIVTVAASDNRDDAIFFSNYGTGSVDLFAPGYNILSLYNSGPTATRVFSGTSMSAPFVTGSFALLRAQFPGDTYRQLINRLLGSVDPSVDGNANFAAKAQTSGRLDLASAVTSTSNRPFNDNFASRAHLAGTTVNVRSNNAGATREAAEPVIAGNAGGASLWWDWTAPATGTVAITTSVTLTAGVVAGGATLSSSYPTLVAVYTGTALNSLTPVAGNASPGNGASQVSFTAQAGTTYEITVDGQNGATGPTVLSLNYANDAFETPITLTGTSVGITASNFNATREPGEPDILGNAGGQSVWYAWTAPASGRFQISVATPAFVPLLAVYTGSSLASLSLVSANMGESFPAADITSASSCTFTFSAVAGTTYSISVDGVIDSYKISKVEYGTLLAAGQFTLSIADSRWQAPTLDTITCAPTVGSDGTVYVGSNDFGFYAFNPDGSAKWTFAQSFGYFDGSTAALSSDGTVIYAISIDYYATQKGYLYALNTSDGSLKWQVPLQNAPPACSPTVASDGTIYVKDEASTLFALNPADGSTKWTFPVSGTSASSPVIAPDGTIYLGSDNGSLYAITSGGSSKWTFTPGNAASNPIYTTAAIDGSGNIYFGTLGGLFYALNSSGQQIWSSPFQAGNSITSSPALDATGTVYFGCYDRNLYALATASGALQWKYGMGGEIRGSLPTVDSNSVSFVGSSPAIDSDGVIYIGCLDDNVYAINSTGTLNRVYATGGGVSSSPVIAGTTLYFGSTDHKLYAFDLGASAAGSPWPMYLYNSRRVGRAVTDPLAITAQSSATVSVTAPAALTLWVAATGEGPLNFQWKLNGVSIPGATNSTYVAPTTGPANGGTYTAVVSGPQGSTTSSPVTVTVVAFAPTFTLAASPSTAQIGTGRTVVFNAVATGTPAPSYQWTLNGSATIPGATVTNDPILVITGATSADDGTIACTATNSDGSATSSATLSVIATTTPGYLDNLAGRALVGSGAANALFGGFGISGTGTKQLLIRGMGPSLLPGYIFTVSDALLDTQLTLYNNNSVAIASNSPWGGTAALIAADSLVGAYAPVSTTSLDSMLFVPVGTGPSSASIAGVNGDTGDAVIEIYDTDSLPLAAKLNNLAVRAPVGTGNDILFGGFAIGGTTDETILIRAVGPGLATTFSNQFTPAQVLAQPVLSVYNGGTFTGYANTGWGGDQALVNAMNTVGAYPLVASSQDSLLLITLPPGSYSAEVSGLNATTGIAVVEIYEVY